MSSTMRALLRKLAPLLVLVVLVVHSDARAAGSDLAQFNEFINQGLRQMQIPGVRNHSQLPDGVRRAIHDSLARVKARGATVDASTVIEHLSEWEQTIRRGAQGAARGSRAVRIARRAMKGGFSIGIGLVIVTGTAWAGGRQPSATDLAGALPIVGLPITFYAVADELISEQVEQTLAAYEGVERSQRWADASRWGLAIALVNHGIRNAGQMCQPPAESAPPPCREVRPRELVECLDGQLERANSLVLIGRPLSEKIRQIDEGVRMCFERAITFDTGG